MNSQKNRKHHQPAQAAAATHRGDRLVLMLTTAVLAMVLGVVTARAQGAPLQDAMAQGWTGYEEQVLRVNVWHDRDEDEVYRKGESVRLHFETNSDAYAVAYRIDSEGEVEILWPRSRLDDGFVFANHTYNLPAPGSRRLRTAGEEGIEYVQVIVSAYPFDLRQLRIDFHHEQTEESYRHYVAGDPFLAMNDVNYEITGLEEPEDFVVANYTSWYVGSRVDHPRYLCSQCHDDEVSRHPYRDSCTIEIHHNYGWDNDWYASHGYYPVYYYPVYYYIDPWTWRPWVNYWYRPWYSWPNVGWGWGWDCYAWNYSPYWSGDVWVRYQGGNRRYRPLGKEVRYKESAGNVAIRHPRGLGKSPQPGKDVRDAMANRIRSEKPLRGKADTARATKPARDRFADVSKVKREHKKIPAPRREERRGGLQVPRTQYPSTIGTGTARSRDDVQTRPGTGSVQSGTKPGSRQNDRVRDTSPSRQSPASPRVRPVEPRSKGPRIWNGGTTGRRDGSSVKPRSGGTERSRPASRPAVKPTVKPKSSKGSSSRPQPTVKPKSSKGSSSSSRSAVKPRSGSSTRKATPPPRSSSSSKSGSSKGSSKSSGSSKSGGGSSKKR